MNSESIDSGCKRREWRGTNTNSTAVAHDFLTFVRASPSPFHAVAEARTRLEAAGFVGISERDAWTVKLNGRYFFTRNQSSLVAFGGAYKPGNGFAIIGAHTDSPCLKVKPISKKATSATPDGPILHKLVHIDEPSLRIPTLAIHLDRTVGDGFTFNKEVHLTPMLGVAAKTLNGAGDKDKTLKHHGLLLNKIAAQLNIKGTIGGINDEFIFSARLDNLMSSYLSIVALIKSVKETGSESDPLVRVVSLFDNEEIGSQTAFGADSDLLEVTLRRIAGATVKGQQPGTTSFEQSLSKSFLISADIAHAVHPNYSEKHEDNHRSSINKGVVIKQNANQRYATTAVTTTILREVAKSET
ncbi:UNVERIFIED_CONTAM: hypothetical protein HDU68_003876 [Siphonaria sp. JEL0065]|nr:hypothetical protein HDU68_003876 [Siphonaria sp. JEL0065]